MQWIVPLEEKVPQSLWKRLIAQGSGSPLGESFKIQRLFTKHVHHGFAPGGVFREWVSGILREPFERIPQQVQTIPDGKFHVQLMGFLQKVDGQRQHVGWSEGQMIPKNGQFIVSSRIAYGQRRLEPG